MIQIRVGDSWKHDPALRAALRRTAGAARAAAVSRIIDVLAIEVDGVDLAAGRTEGPLLPSLEGLLRAIARLLSGMGNASVPLREGEIELVLRRREASALLTFVELGPPSRVLAREVEVDLEALSAAALAATADLVRALAETEPTASSLPGARKLEAAALALRRTDAAAHSSAGRRGRPTRPPGEQDAAVEGGRARSSGRARASARSRKGGAVRCTVELRDDEGVLGTYVGGPPDLGSLLAPGTVAVLASDGAELASVPGAPFLVLRDLTRAAEAIVAALRRGDPEVGVPLAPARRGTPPALRLDLGAGLLVPPVGPPIACPPLDLATALLGAAADFVRVVRARHPRQGENGYLAELEAAAAAGLAHVAELAAGDVVHDPVAAREARAPARAPPSQRPLGPGRLRRLAFRRVLAFEVGAPGGDALHRAGALLVACGANAVVAAPVAGGPAAWRAGGVRASASAGGQLLLLRDALEAVSFRTGARRWSRTCEDAALSAAALARGPLLLSGPGTLTGVDPGSGRTLWRFAPPGARRLAVSAFGGLAVAATDGALLYGVDAAGGAAWRLRLPGPPLFAPVAAGHACVVACATGPGATLVAIDPAAGRRLWEAPLDFAPSAPPLAVHGRVAVAGTVAGDPIVAVLDGAGHPAWTAAPPPMWPLAAQRPQAMHGPVSLAAGARGALIGRDAKGALLALDRAGAAQWQTPPPAGHPPPGHLAPRVVRSAVLAAHEDLAVHDAATGALLGAAPGLAPVRLIVDPELRVVAMDAEGVVTVLRLATHLSVV
jgi:hypothetical protein